MYSILQFGGSGKKAANGVPEHVKNDEITHKEYKDCLGNVDQDFMWEPRFFQRIINFIQLL